MSVMFAKKKGNKMSVYFEGLVEGELRGVLAAKCEKNGSNHSTDLLEIYCGNESPKYLCGFHNQIEQRAADKQNAEYQERLKK